MENNDNSNEGNELNNVNNELEENSNSINVEENSIDNDGKENVADNIIEISNDSNDKNEPSAEEIIDVVSENIEKDSSLLINDDVVNLDIANVVAKRKKGKGKKRKKKNQINNSNNNSSDNNRANNGNNNENIENVENIPSNNNEENIVESAIAEEVVAEGTETQESVEQVNEIASNENEENAQNSVETETSNEDVDNTNSGDNNSNKKNKNKNKKKKEVSDDEEEIVAIEEVKEKQKESKQKDSNNVVKVKKKHNVRRIVLIILGILVVAACTCLGIAYYDIKTTKIEFDLIGEDVVIEVGQAKYEESGVVATRNDKDIKEEVIVDSDVNDEVVGEYKVSYNLKIDILGYDHTLVRHVTIHDTTPPELNVESEDEFVAYIGDEFNVPSYSANDSYDGDLTEKVEVDNQVDNTTPGTYTITYTVSDSSNNTSSKTITVKVEKKKNPKIVVSISEQTLCYYEYDQVVLTSNVVTGVNNQTPTGTFKILNKARNVDLKGDDYVSHVQYWLAFKGNSYGFHDASWRSNFGGSIYIRNGSHGCVNMPYSKVQQLYNMVSVGTPVYIYR